MTDYGKQFDDILEIHTDAINSGQIIALEVLQKAIADYKLTEIYQVEKLIQGQLDALKSRQYEADARADHITEQMPNV